MANFISRNAGDVFRAVLRACGYYPMSWQGTQAERNRFADMVNAAVGSIWSRVMWPPLLVVARITYRDAWDAERQYLEGDEVHVRDSATGAVVYFRAMRATIGEAPTLHATRLAEPTLHPWAPAVGMLPSFSFAEHFIDEMDLEAGLFAAHPERVREARAFSLARTSFGACVNEREFPSEPWIRFRPLRPYFSWQCWSEAHKYTERELCFYADSTWIALAPNTNVAPDSDGTVWQPVPFPELFLEYVALSAKEMWSTDAEAKAQALVNAEAEAERLMRRYVDATRVRRRARVRVTSY